MILPAFTGVKGHFLSHSPQPRTYLLPRLFTSYFHNDPPRFYRGPIMINASLASTHPLPLPMVSDRFIGSIHPVHGERLTSLHKPTQTKSQHLKMRMFHHPPAQSNNSSLAQKKVIVNRLLPFEPPHFLGLLWRPDLYASLPHCGHFLCNRQPVPLRHIRVLVFIRNFQVSVFEILKLSATLRVEICTRNKCSQSGHQP